ncbi:MAG: peptidase MA family metallohydrolase [Desulfotomaculaceae bacterium]|nr:peptidase MA family metallohydrolase [Desulfotomaculaceae bacterium]
MKRAIKIFTFILILIITLLGRLPAYTKQYGYGTIREFMILYTMLKVWRLEEITSEHFRVKFMPGNRAEAELILETAEYFYLPVTADFGFSLRNKIPIILYPSRETLNKSFGWDAKENAMGVYWAGTIRVLSPGIWAGDNDTGKLKETFFSSGPMAHELTHLVVDYLTRGNYPRWFTEGIALHEEYKLTGYVIKSAEGSLQQQHYSVDELTVNFDKLSDQTLAYAESFAAVQYIVQNFGEVTLLELIFELGKGNSLSYAMEKITGLNIQEFEKGWQEWRLSPVLDG